MRVEGVLEKVEELEGKLEQRGSDIVAAVEGKAEEVIEEVSGVLHNMDLGYGGGVMRFVQSVDWTEPWLIGLISLHLLLLTLAVTSRKHNNAQTVLFLTTLLGVYLAERLNAVAQEHWGVFARWPYFDAQGLFLATVWSGPLLLVAALVLLNSVMQLVSLIVKWKKAVAKHQARLARQKTE